MGSAETRGSLRGCERKLNGLDSHGDSNQCLRGLAPLHSILTSDRLIDSGAFTSPWSYCSLQPRVAEAEGRLKLPVARDSITPSRALVTAI